jgi:hypothetical protein
VRSKLKSEKRFKFSIKFGKNSVLNVHIWSKIVEIKLGDLGKIWQKSGQSLEKVSQPRGLRFHSNKYDFLKLE